MAERPKPSPGGAPPAPRPQIAADAGLPRISVRVDGGPRGEEYRFHFEASAGGAVLVDFKSDLAGRQVDGARGTIAPAEFERLLRAANTRQLRTASRARPAQIPPCSLVGTLEVFDGRERVQVVFMADAEQAREAGYRIPAAVSRLTKRIYTIAAQQLGLKSADAIRVPGT
jgi:hypothetical protein